LNYTIVRVGAIGTSEGTTKLNVITSQNKAKLSHYNENLNSSKTIGHNTKYVTLCMLAALADILNLQNRAF